MTTRNAEFQVFYADGALRRLVASISVSEREFRVVLEKCPAHEIPFSSRQLQEFIRRLIELPLNINAMRCRAMPGLFETMQRGSAEHLREMCRQLGPFHLVNRTC